MLVWCPWREPADLDPAIEDLVGVHEPWHVADQASHARHQLAVQREDVTSCEKLCGPIKDNHLENDVYEQISQCASAFEFRSSTWNKDLSTNEVGLMIRESTAYNAVSEAFD